MVEVLWEDNENLEKKKEASKKKRKIVEKQKQEYTKAQDKPPITKQELAKESANKKIYSEQVNLLTTQVKYLKDDEKQNVVKEKSFTRCAMHVAITHYIDRLKKKRMKLVTYLYIIGS